MTICSHEMIITKMTLVNEKLSIYRSFLVGNNILVIFVESLKV